VNKERNRCESSYYFTRRNVKWSLSKWTIEQKVVKESQERKEKVINLVRKNDYVGQKPHYRDND